MKFKSIQAKFLITFISAFLITLGSLFMVSHYLMKNEVTKSTETISKTLSSDYANQIKSYMNELMLNLKNLATIQRIRAGTNKEQMVEAMQELHKRAGVFDTVFFIWPDGSGIRFNGSTAHYGDREYVRKVINTKEPYISDVLVSKATGELSIILAVPVIYNNNLTGILAASYPLKNISEMIKDLKFENTGYGFITDNAGLMIGHPKRPDLIGKRNINNKELNADAEGKKLDDKLIKLFRDVASSWNTQSYGEYVSSEGIARIGAATPINLPGGQHWALVVSAPQTEVEKYLNDLENKLLFISAAFTVFIIMVVIFICKKFTRPIVLLRNEFSHMAKGDLTEREIAIDSADELGELARSFVDMRRGLRRLVANIKTEAEQVSASSQELTAGAQSSAASFEMMNAEILTIAADTNKQASLAKNISAAAENMSQNNQQVSILTKEVADIAAHTSKEAVQGRQAVEKAIAHMKQIGEGSDTVQTVVNELAKGSNQISEIVNLISSIAGQTNLLALNAAIEAARAGEQGRGFAVVAEEVRTLAESSNLAAQQIGNLIAENQKNMQHVVTATQAGEESIKTGVEAVNVAGEIFANIVAGIVSLSNQSGEISGAVENMAAASNMLAGSSYEISAASHSNSAEIEKVLAKISGQAAFIEEISAASQSLARLAGNLHEETTTFIV